MTAIVVESAGTVQFDQSFTATVERISLDAQAKLPELASRLQRATGLVLADAVWLEEDGTSAMVQGSQPGSWWAVNGHCTCPDAARAPQGYCKHRLAKAILLRTQERLRQPVPVVMAADGLPHEPVAVQAMDPRYITQLHGQPFVRYAGLLQLAHARGLQKLEARFISVTEQLALAEATATFADGRIFTEAADATPGNVGVQVRPHFARIALVRAKARALRDALAIDRCSVEELADGE